MLCSARLTILSIILQYLSVLQLVCVWLSVCLCRFVIQMHTYLHWLYSRKSKQGGINKARYKKELSQEMSQLMHCSHSFCLHLFYLKRIVAHASMFGLYKCLRRMVQSATLPGAVILLVSLAIFDGFLKRSYTGVKWFSENHCVHF